MTLDYSHECVARQPYIWFFAFDSSWNAAYVFSSINIAQIKPNKRKTTRLAVGKGCLQHMNAGTLCRAHVQRKNYTYICPVYIH